MRTTLGLLIVLVTLMSDGSRPADAGKQKPLDYYPLKEGTKWHYRMDANGRLVQLVNQIAKIETIDGLALARLETVVQGTVGGAEHLRSTAEGVFRHRIFGLEVTPPFCLLKYPVKDGESWNIEFKVGDENSKGVCLAGKDEVTVPAGKYKTVTVRVEMETGGQKIHTTYWFAAGIGVVKQIADIGGKSMTMELEKYEEGK